MQMQYATMMAAAQPTQEEDDSTMPTEQAPSNGKKLKKG